ncbi:MAG: energy transducer TonB [Pseudomonadota bacterium]
MKRIIISAVIAIGFHIALMVLMPSLFNKNNKILPPEIKSVMVTISYRQPILKQTSFKPDKPKKENRSINEIKTKPKPPKAISFTPKKKTSTILKKKNLAKPEKKLIQNKPVIHNQKEVIKKKSNPVKMVEKKPIKAEKKQNFKEQLATVKRTTPQKKEIIKQKKPHIEFAKPLYKENTLPVYPVIAQKRGYHGVVELMVLVSEKGKVSSLKILKSSGYKSLDRQAVKTVKNWLFEPGKKNGSPQEMWVKIPVRFELN